MHLKKMRQNGLFCRQNKEGLRYLQRFTALEGMIYNLTKTLDASCIAVMRENRKRNNR